MKAEIYCDDSGLLKVTISAQHEFEKLLLESLNKKDVYEESMCVKRDYSEFGINKPVVIELNFRIKK